MCWQRARARTPRARRAHQVEPALDDQRRHLGEATQARRELTWREKAVVDEVVELDPGAGEHFARSLRRTRCLGPGVEAHDGLLVRDPALGGEQCALAVLAAHQVEIARE